MFQWLLIISGFKTYLGVHNDKLLFFKKIYNFYLLHFILCEPNFLGIINLLFPGNYYILFGVPFMSFFSYLSQSYFLNHFLCTILISYTIPGFKNDILLFFLLDLYIYFLKTIFPHNQFSPTTPSCYLPVPDPGQWNEFLPLPFLCLPTPAHNSYSHHWSPDCTDDLTLLPGPPSPSCNSSVMGSLNLWWCQASPLFNNSHWHFPNFKTLWIHFKEKTHPIDHQCWCKLFSL